MKVLIITRHFFPYFTNFGSMSRILKMAEFLTQNNIDVFILAAKGHEYSYFGYKDIVQKFNLVYLEDPWQMRLTQPDLLLDANAQKPVTMTNKTNYDSQADAVQKITLRALLRHLFDEMTVPDRGIYFNGRYVKKALEIIQQHHIKNIIISAPPFSMQLVGVSLKRILKGQIQFIADFRDSWNTRPVYRKQFAIPQWFNKRLEKKVLINVDHVLGAAPAILTKINKEIYNISAKSTLITNGYDQQMKMPKLRTKNSILKIGYFGSISDAPGSFNEKSYIFFEELNKFSKEICLCFYGQINISRSWSHNFCHPLEIHNNLPHKEALKKMQEMDLLLMIYTEKEGCEEVITGKIFDYMLAQRPILVIGPTQMECSKMVVQNQLGYVIDLHQENILHRFTEIYKDWENDTLADFSIENLSKYSRQYQFAKLLKVLGK